MAAVIADLKKISKPCSDDRAIAQVGTRGGLYIGDTADDFDLVRLYRESQLANEPPILAAMVAHKDDVALYQQRGADLIVSSVEDLRKIGANDGNTTFIM